MAPDNRLDELTAREREVLDLVRLGLTNEEIAARLGITEAGIKYHVSQILSRLGVSTREEAAIVVLGTRPRRWSALPLAAKVASVVVILAAVAGLGLLAWGVLSTTGESEVGTAPDFSGCQLTVNSVVDCWDMARRRPNRVLHVTGEETTSTGDVSFVTDIQAWLDFDHERARSTRALRNIDWQQLFVANTDEEYVVNVEDGQTTKAVKQPRSSSCTIDSAPPPSTVYLCVEREVQRTNATVDAAVFEGKQAVVLSGQWTKEIGDYAIMWHYRLTLDQGSYLLITSEKWYTFADGSGGMRWETRWRNEFVAADSLPDEFFDPAAIGYAEPSPTP